MNAILKGAIGFAVALFVSLGAGAASAQSVSMITLKDNTTVSLTYQTSSCVGTLNQSWPSTILAGSSATRAATSTLTSNGCSVT